MTDIVSLCPFPAGAILWEAQPGQRSLTVIVKGTFALAPGDLAIAAEQDGISEERHWDDNGMASVHWPGDYAPSKRRVDVMLVGHAYAPRGDPMTSLVAQITVGELVKAVRVTGDRSWTHGSGAQLEPGPPSPFLRMPLRYERAALSADNPIGIDPHAPPRVATPARPNLERIDAGESGLFAMGDTPTPPPQACFGPVAPTWRARRKLLDEAATFWAYGVARDPRTAGPPIGSAPPRFDFAFFNAAPPDQQIDLLRPGTPLVLDHLHPAYPRLATRLPALRPQVFRVPPPGAPRARVEEIILRCDTLWIDTDRAVAVLSWRGVADVGAADDAGHLVVALDPEGKKLRWDRVEKWLGEHGSTTMRLGPDGRFELEAPEPAPPDLLARRHDAVKGQLAVDIGGDPRTLATGVDLPSAMGEVTESGIHDAPTNPLDRSLPEAPPRPAPRAAHAVKVTTGETPGPPPEDESAETLVMRPRALGLIAGPAPARLVTMGSQPAPVPTEPVAVSIVDAPTPPPEAPTPPLPGVRAKPPAPGPKAGAAKARRPTGGLVLRKDLTVQRYAEISAALAQKGAARAPVLRAHLLTEAAWALVDQTWKKNIAAETAQGGSALADDFDDAYVAHQERLGSPIDLCAYARLQVAVERGAVGQVLAELDLELGDLLRLQRVWARRAAGAPEVAAALAHAVDEARRAG